MMDSEVHSQVVKWIASLVDPVTVVKAYQSQDVDPPYLMVNLTTIREVRENEQTVEYEEGTVPDEDDQLPITARPVIETEWMFSVHAYGQDPTTIIRPLRAAALLPQVGTALGAGLHIQEVSPIRHVPEYVKEAWEPRSQMDIFVRGLVRDGFIVDVIEDVSFTFPANKFGA